MGVSPARRLRPNLDPGLDEHSHIYHASVAAEYSVSEWLRVVSDLSVERNADRSGRPNVGSVVVGLVVRRSSTSTSAIAKA